VRTQTTTRKRRTMGSRGILQAREQRNLLHPIDTEHHIEQGDDEKSYERFILVSMYNRLVDDATSPLTWW
jgi:hypothetical protein